MVKSTLTAMALGLALVGSSAFANNPPPTIKADAPNRYVVKKGDTLWAIAGRYLDKPTRWREIWATNQQIKNPNLIYPNDVLILCIIQGQTLVGVDTGEGCAGVEKQTTTLPSQDMPPSSEEQVLTPAVEAQPVGVVVTSAANSIPTVPLSTIRHWLTYSVIVSEQDFENTPYVLASKGGNLITAKDSQIYIKGAPLIVGQRYGVYRKGDPYVDGHTNQVIGLEATQVAAGVITSVSGNGVSSMRITESYNSEVREGDRVFVEVDAPMPQIFYPAPASLERGGLIIRTIDGMTTVAKNGVVSINLGSVDGIQPGHVLDVYKRGSLVRDVHNNNAPVRLPSELAGQIMVFKAFNRISYAYVLTADVPLKVGDQLLPPEW